MFLFCELASQLGKEMFTETAEFYLHVSRTPPKFQRRDISNVSEIWGGVKITQMYLKDSTLVT